MDVLGRWIEERCVPDPAAELQAARAYDDYKTWAIHNGHNVLTGQAFGRRLGERFTKQKTRAHRFYLGLRLKTCAEIQAESAQPVAEVADPRPKRTTKV